MKVMSLLRQTSACLAIIALSSCSDSNSGETSQVVARVGDAELTAAQFDTRLRRLPDSVDKRDPQVLKLVLKNFINETLLAQAAEKDGLDKKPAVARDIENSRNVVLASAYVNRNITSRPASESAIRRYYNDNPAMFSNRRTYRLTDLAVRETQANAAAVIAEMKRPGASIDSVLAIARANNVPVEAVNGVDSGENLPSKLAAGLVNMAIADNVTYRVAETQHFTRVDAVADTPLSLAGAHDTIAGLLLAQARETAVQAKLGQLRVATTVEYGAIGREIEAGRGSSASQKRARPLNRTRDGAIAHGAEGL